MKTRQPADGDIGSACMLVTETRLEELYFATSYHPPTQHIERIVHGMPRAQTPVTNPAKERCVGLGY